MKSIVRLKNVFVKISNKTILTNISIQLFKNEIVTLIGPNGAGKSTLVEVILGLIKPQKGVIFLKKNIRIGYVPQKFFIDNYFKITVNRFLFLSKNMSNKIVNHILNRINILHLKEKQMTTLSGGEMQKVLLAKALIISPDFLILDELTQGIDLAGQIYLYNLIRIIKNELKCTVLIVSHDINLVMSKTDRVICLNNHICCFGTPKVISKNAEFNKMFRDVIHPELTLYNHDHNHYHKF
ncbi:Zinc import ATP-binding protein ZnuC [Buchnera aphidicola (Thelaxes suberi)]|uniref:ATP-binding cassette domain-containing protein n=1 Tax=Buchnera aphidicola TaxID=9 RepID=UPI00346412FF